MGTGVVGVRGPDGRGRKKSESGGGGQGSPEKEWVRLQSAMPKVGRKGDGCWEYFLGSKPGATFEGGGNDPDVARFGERGLFLIPCKNEPGFSGANEQGGACPYAREDFEDVGMGRGLWMGKVDQVRRRRKSARKCKGGVGEVEPKKKKRG